MTANEVEALVRRGESDTIEFKKTTGQLSRAAETICGFLNGHGGILGLSENKYINFLAKDDSSSRHETHLSLAGVQPSVDR